MNDGWNFLRPPNDERADQIHKQRPNQHQSDQSPKRNLKHTTPYMRSVCPARNVTNPRATRDPLLGTPSAGTLKLRPVPHKQKPRAVADAGFSLAA